MKLVLSLFFLATICCQSCIKSTFKNDECLSDCYILSGTVKDLPDHNIVPNMELDLRFWRGKWNKWLCNTKIDENGNWKMSFDADYFRDWKQDCSITIEDKKIMRFSSSVTLDTSMIDIEQVVEINVYRPANLFVRVSVQNPGVEYVSLVRSTPTGGTKEIRIDVSPPVDTLVKWRIEGDIETTVTCKQVAKGVGHPHAYGAQTFTIPSSEQLIIDFNFPE